MYNRSILIGRLVADPELRTTPNGVNVSTFRIAVDRPYSKNAEKKAEKFIFLEFFIISSVKLDIFCFKM